jgi:glycosyltransferase involved in cell wall biosynthesis
VVFVSWAPFFSGAERALLILIDHLDRSKYRPVVVVGTRGELQREIEARGIRTYHVPVVYTGVRTVVAWTKAVGRLGAILRRERAALVHSNDVPSFQPAGYAARLLGVPAITHVRFPDSRDGFGWFLKPGFRRALFVSAALRNDAIREAPELFGARSEVVYDGVRLPGLGGDADRRGLREELGLAVGAPTVALTGQVSEVKGIWEFLDAAEQIARRIPDVQFVVLGDDLKGQGALRREAESRVAARGLSERIRFLGFRPDAPRLIAAFDVIAVPSHVEPLGNATLEAMAAGRPVVGSRVGGIPEMVVDGETGRLVPPRDASALAEALAALVAAPEDARAMGRAGRARAQRLFNCDSHAQNVAASYERVLADAARGAAGVMARTGQRPGPAGGAS